MADLTRNAPLRYRWPNQELQPEIWTLDNSAAQTIYVGCPMLIDASEDTVYPRVYNSGVTKTTGDVFVGIANEAKNVATTDTETDNEIEIIGGNSEVGFKSTVFTDADVGKPVYFSDSGTLTATAGANLLIGKLRRVDGGYAFVQLDAPYVQL